MDISFAEGCFTFDAADADAGNCDVSSGSKWAYRGRYRRYGDDGRDMPAIAVFSCRHNDTCLKREMAALGQGEHRGFGPKLLANAESARPDDESNTRLSVAIEEYAGIALNRALSGNPIPGERPTTLADPATPEGKRQTAKILFDITCQIANMHRCGLFHHDLKSSNVCVKSIGDNPWDLRATVIDFDHAMHDADGYYVQSTPVYYNLLFRDLANPAEMPAGYAPTSLERDLGCLAVVWCETMYRKELRFKRMTGSYSLSREELSHVFERESPFFWYEGGIPRARRLDFYSDIAPFAKQAGLIDAQQLALPFDVQCAASLFKCERYFDAQSMRDLKHVHEQYLGYREDAIARAIFENYNAHLRADGDPVKYPDFETQPIAHRLSNYAQAAGFVSHIWRLGLELVSADRCDARDLVDEFSDEQVMQLARWEHERWMEERLDAGWTLGETADGRSDVGRRISPSLVPFDELDAKMRSYDAEPMRQMIPILRTIGLGLRPRA